MLLSLTITIQYISHGLNIAFYFKRKDLLFMEELKLSLQETKDFFVQAFRENMLVPILGSGFTRGMNTSKGGVVPSGTELKTEMINRIVSKLKIDKIEIK